MIGNSPSTHTNYSDSTQNCTFLGLSLNHTGIPSLHHKNLIVQLESFKKIDSIALHKFTCIASMQPRFHTQIAAPKLMAPSLDQMSQKKSEEQAQAGSSRQGVIIQSATAIICQSILAKIGGRTDQKAQGVHCWLHEGAKSLTRISRHLCIPGITAFLTKGPNLNLPLPLNQLSERRQYAMGKVQKM